MLCNQYALLEKSKGEYIIFLDGDDFLDVANVIGREIEAEIAKEREQERWDRYEEDSWKLEQDMLEYDNRSIWEMMDD